MAAAAKKEEKKERRVRNVLRRKARGVESRYARERNRIVFPRIGKKSSCTNYGPMKGKVDNIEQLQH